jgi:fructokinase
LLEKLRARTGVARWCVTLGARGAVWWDGGPLVRAAAPVVRVRDTVGAGDAFLAALVDGLTRDGRVDWPAPKAMALWLARACRLGALVAGRDGACPDYDPAEIMDADAVPKRPRTAVRSP